MNIVFWILVIACIILLWFSLSFIFKGFGKFFLRLYGDVKEAIKQDNDNIESEE